MGINVQSFFILRFDARKDCEHKLGYLVEFQNKEQEDKVTEFVKEEFDVGRFWIGAFDPSKPSNKYYNTSLPYCLLL